MRQEGRGYRTTDGGSTGSGLRPAATRQANTGRGRGGEALTPDTNKARLPQQLLVKGLRLVREVRNEVLTEGQKDVSAATNQKPADQLAQR